MPKSFSPILAKAYVGTQLTQVMPADIEVLGQLARLIWQHAYTGIVPQAQIDYMLAQRYNPQRLVEELRTPGIWWDKALVDGELSAFASTLLTDIPGEMQLDKLYVHPERQRIGLGGRFIELATSRARDEGCDTLILAVNKQNERAIAAYKKYGFDVRDAAIVDIGDGFFMDDFIMAKALV